MLNRGTHCQWDTYSVGTYARYYRESERVEQAVQQAILSRFDPTSRTRLQDKQEAR